MREIIPFVVVKNATEAIEFYKKVLDAELVGNITYLENVPGMDKEKYKGLIGHSTLQIGRSRFFLKDDIDLRKSTFGDHIQFVLNFDTETELKEAFDALQKDGKVIDNLQEVFWGALYGSVEDKFGVVWQIYSGHK